MSCCVCIISGQSLIPPTSPDAAELGTWQRTQHFASSTIIRLHLPAAAALCHQQPEWVTGVCSLQQTRRPGCLAAGRKLRPAAQVSFIVSSAPDTYPLSHESVHGMFCAYPLRQAAGFPWALHVRTEHATAAAQT